MFISRDRLQNNVEHKRIISLHFTCFCLIFMGISYNLCKNISKRCVNCTVVFWCGVVFLNFDRFLYTWYNSCQKTPLCSKSTMKTLEKLWNLFKGNNRHRQTVINVFLFFKFFYCILDVYRAVVKYLFRVTVREGALISCFYLFVFMFA